LGEERFNFAVEVGRGAVEGVRAALASGVVEGFDMLPAGGVMA